MHELDGRRATGTSILQNPSELEDEGFDGAAHPDSNEPRKEATAITVKDLSRSTSPSLKSCNILSIRGLRFMTPDNKRELAKNENLDLKEGAFNGQVLETNKSMYKYRMVSSHLLYCHHTTQCKLM
jgi:hypothetical protein